MRSGYKALVKPLNLDIIECNTYKQIWNLNCPSKVRILLWKFACNFIPTLQNLHFRRISFENRFPRCQIYSESNLHVSRDCYFAK